METTNYGHLSRQLKEETDRLALSTSHQIVAFSMPSIRSLIPEFNRLERIVSALESIGVSLDEEDIGALESLCDGTRRTDVAARDLAGSINHFVGMVQSDLREHEQDQAIEYLAAAGFVLNDDDGETWTRGNETVKIELTNGRESRYKWEYENPAPELSSGVSRVTNLSCGVSGEFHRLLKLIAPVDSDSACGGSASTEPCKTVGTVAWPGGGGIPKGPIDIVCGPGVTIDPEAFPSASTVTETSAPTTHTHVAHYVDGQLMRDCGQCGLDLTHSSHARLDVKSCQ